MAFGIEFVGGDLVAMVAIAAGAWVSFSAVRMTYRNEQRARTQQRRFEAYAAVLAVVRRIMGQVAQHALTPGYTTLSDPDQGEIERAEAVLTLIGSSDVVEAFQDWRSRLGSYWLMVLRAARARGEADRLQSAEESPQEGWLEANHRAESERIALSVPVSEIEEIVTRLERAMRAEIE